MIRVVFILLSLLIVLSVAAQERVTVRTATGVHIEPSALAPTFAELSEGEAVTIRARAELPQWVLVENDHVMGWIPAGMTDFDGDLIALPMWTDTLTIPDDATLTTSSTMRDFTDNADLLAHIDTLLTTPILHNMTTDTLDTIFAEGQALGNRADVFTKVGDSDTTSGDYLQPIGLGEQYCELGAYNYLQTTIDHFSTPPLDGIRTSFNNLSIAAVNGLTMVAALDPFWTDSPACNNGESPLSCEYRLVRPSVAVIMLGRMDVTYFDVDFYRETATDVIEESIASGVIPVLTTFVVLPDNEAWEASLAFNATLIELANTYDVPLINLWRAVQTLPQFGIGPDLTHLKHEVGQFCTFTGAETRLGGTLRNLLTLQALDSIRRSTLTDGG